MTKALNKALDLYPPPETWEPARGIQRQQTPEDEQRTKRQIMLRSSLLADDWPFMVRAFCTAMRLPVPTEPTPLSAQERAEHSQRLYQQVNDFSAAADTIQQADELFGIAYLAVRALIGLGLTNNQVLAGFTETHASNMTKVQDNGMPLVNDGVINPEEPIGKILKTHNYVAPDLAEAMSIKDE